MIKKLTYKNSFSFIFGVLCIGVVYLHSNWIGGFNIYTLGLNNHTLSRMISLMLLTIVPSFFIMWGYLSEKYFFSYESAKEFLKRKLIQFYPIYVLSFTIKLFYISEHMLSLPKWKLILNFLGLYYESGMGGGGNIYLVVLFVILTVTFLKLMGIGRYGVILYTIICMVLTKYLPHESSFCYFQYFGYYTAFFIGVVLKQFGIFDERCCVNNYEKRLILLFAMIGLLTPLLNLMNIKILEIQYEPNSFEQLLFCCLILYGINRLLNLSKVVTSEWVFVRFLHIVGNNAYGHFIIHTHVVLLFVYINSIIHFNKFIMQLLVISCTSYISVFWILRVYQISEVFIRKAIRSC